MHPPPPEPTPPASRLPTAELLVRARDGHRDAIAELCERYEPRVRGLAALRMGRTLTDLHDFDDIVQETLMTALRGLPHFEPATDGGFVAWLASIVTSRIEDARRSGRAEKRGGGTVRRRADLGLTTLSTLGPADPARSPSQVAAAAELDARLERALLALGTPLREIVYQRLVLDMSHGDIASNLGLAGADSCRALFHKALARLRQRLESGPDE